MKEYRIIIAGGRDFSDYDKLKGHVDKCINEALTEHRGSEIIIVSGKAKGADSLGERYAKEKGYKIAEYPADWKKNGRAAGLIRNKQMADSFLGWQVIWYEEYDRPGSQALSPRLSNL